ncbi:hypothetical protein PhCBS80983_g05984 [Powellomyces hirtus]|uniref:NDT80 domain-containing protein n=1 Tax=Powellomyces hirtus TaxID=109895 RepID=A0A507DSL8_9FUNG|nr:hypothetical protein PhCBS80983_g05984 [Powellomyces hirtus]
MAAVSVEQANLQQPQDSPSAEQRTLHNPIHYQQQQPQQRAYPEQTAAYPLGPYSPIKSDPATFMPHPYISTHSQQQPHDSQHDGYLPPPMSAGYDAPRKLSIDTTVVKPSFEPNYAPTSPGYYSLPPMESPTRRRRADPLEPYSINVGPFFKPTKQIYNLYSIDRARLFSLRINPKVDRGFFLADSDWTCYRRNYFQVSASFSACDTHGQEVELPCLMEMENNLYTVTGFALGISARVGNGEKTIDLIQHTPKRDKGPQLVPQPRPVRSGGNPHQYNGIGTNNLVATFERLQFKTATANNGKRRAAQQYYVLNLDLFAQLDNGQQFKVAYIESAPLVVRGRSPGHYADGNLDALRVFPMDAYGRRSDYYGSPMSPYMASSMYSPATPGGAMVSPPSPAGGISMPGHYHGNPHQHLSSMSAPAGPDMSNYHPLQYAGRPGAEHMNPLHTVWHRARADSLANSEASYTTNATNMTASSYNSLEFDDMERTTMGARGKTSISPVTPPGTAHPSPVSASPVVNRPAHQTHHHQQAQHPKYYYSSSPKHGRMYSQYSSVPNWVDDANAHPSSPNPMTRTSDLNHMMVGFGFRGQNKQAPAAEHHHENIRHHDGVRGDESLRG